MKQFDEPDVHERIGNRVRLWWSGMKSMGHGAPRHRGHRGARHNIVQLGTGRGRFVWHVRCLPDTSSSN